MENRLLDGIGSWCHRLTEVLEEGQAALFLDRDGVVIEDTHYLCQASDVRLTTNIAAAIKAANDAGIPVIIVTNQSGIGRGLYNWAAFESVQNEIIRLLSSQGARIDLVLACAYHEMGQGRLKIKGHSWRKPNPGMIFAAADIFDTNLRDSLIVGDRITDLMAGKNAGLGQGTLVRTGFGLAEETSLSNHTWGEMQISVCDTLSEAVYSFLSTL